MLSSTLYYHDIFNKNIQKFEYDYSNTFGKRNKTNQEKDQNKNSAKLVLFIFGIGPIIGIIIFLYSKGFFNSPNM